MNETKKREILNINNRKNQQSVEKNSYVLKKEDYKKLFYLKFSFYALMRRIHNWFIRNQDNPYIKNGFVEFKLYVSGDEKDINEDKFTFRRMGMFFSDQFLNENMYVSGKNGLSEAMKLDYNGNKIRNVNLSSDPKKADGTSRISFQNNSWMNIFCKPVKSNSVVTAYNNILLNENEVLLKEEEERVCGLVKKWFPTEVIRQQIISEVIESEFFIRSITSVPGNGVTFLEENKDTAYEAIFLDEDFFEMSNVVIRGKNCNQKAIKLIADSELQKIGMKELKIYGGEHNLQKNEERINDFFDELEVKKQTIVIDKNGRLKKTKISSGKKYVLENEMLIRKKFDACKQNTIKFIADVIITTLCLPNLEDALKKIWKCEFTSKDIVGKNFEEKTLKTICFYPLISRKNLLENLVDFVKEKTEFYKTEYSFLNWLVYINWQDMSKYIVGVEQKEELLLEFYKFYKSYWKKQFKNDDDVKFIKEVYDTYNADYFIKRSMLACANMILDCQKNDLYKEIENMLSWVSEDDEDEEYQLVLDEKKVRLKYKIIVEKKYKEAYQDALEVYRNSLEEGIIGTYILPCLKEIKDTRGDVSDFCVEGKNIDESIKFWDEIRTFNGDSSAIRRKWNEKCKLEIQDRIKLLARKYNGLDIDIEVHKAKKSISINNSTKEIYIVLGFSEKAQIFIDSVLDKKDVEIKLVLQKQEIRKMQSLERWYQNTNIEILNDDIIDILSDIDLYNLWEKFEEDPFAFKNYCESKVKKIHFLALGDNKSDNLSYVLAVINETWKRYVMYRIMEPITDYKMDFAEVDIIVDSMPTTPWYLDSIANRFEDDFYIKINSYSENELAIRDLLTEYPLFLADLNNQKNNDNMARHDVLILGGNKIILDIIKNILMVNGFMRNDKITAQDLNAVGKYEYGEFEQKICSDSSLYIIDKNASVIKDKLLCDCPDIFKDRDYIHCVPEFFDLDILSYKFQQLFGVQFRDELYIDQLENTTNSEQKDQLELYDVVRKANYIIIATDNEEEAISLSMKIREYRYRLDIQDEPVISVYTPESNLDENIDEFTIGKETYGNAWHRSYRINMFGKRRKIYSREYLYKNYFNIISHELHMDDDYRKREQKERDYYKVVYNRNSCDARTMAIPYMMYSVLGTDMIKDFTLESKQKKTINKWSMGVFYRYIENYLNEYRKIVGEGENKGKHPGWREIIACLEHHRWNYWMMAVQGYSSSPFGDMTMQYVKDTIRSWAMRTTELSSENEKNAVRDNKLYIAKMHFSIRTFDSLGEPKNDQDDASGFEKAMLELSEEKGVTEGMKTTKNRKYDRKYASEMVLSLARAFKIRLDTDKIR